MKIFILIVFFSIICYISPLIFRVFGTYNLKKKCIENKLLLLTYDDGPGEKITPIILEILKKNKVNATFFVLAKKINNNCDLLNKIILNNNLVCSHGYEHKKDWFFKPFASISDIKKSLDILKSKGINTFYYRPPFGKINIFSWFYLKIIDIKCCYWTYDSLDTKIYKNHPENLAKKIIQDGGGIILMHDFDSSSERCNYTIELTKILIYLSKIHGIKITTVDKLINTHKNVQICIGK